MARPIGEIVNGIVHKIAEKCGLADACAFTMFPVCATKKGGPEECDNTQPALTCNANKERRS